MRFLLFVVAFLVGVALMAPLDRWVLPIVRGPLEEHGADLRVDSLRLAAPAGIRATGVVLDADGGGLDLDSLYVGLGRTFDADGCGGHLAGSFARDSFSIQLSGVNPSKCLRIGKLELESTLDGSFSIDGVDLLAPVVGASLSAQVDLQSAGGVFRGVIPSAGPQGTDLPLGEWEFNDLVLRGTFARGALKVDEGHAKTSGVELQLLAANLPTPGSKGGLRVDFRARLAEDGPRGKALIGMMPKAEPDSAGWRHYRVVGSMSAPRVVAAE